MEKVKKKVGTIQVLLWIGHVRTLLVQHHGFSSSYMKLRHASPRLLAADSKYKEQQRMRE